MRHLLSFHAAGCHSSARFASSGQARFRMMSRAKRYSASAIANLCMALLACVAFFSAAGFGQVPFPTSRADNSRTNANSNETLLTPANVNQNSFGHLFSVPIDAGVTPATTMLAQPLFMPGVNIPNLGVHNVVYLATLSDWVYAIDADNGAVLWRASMLDGGTTATGTLLPCGFGGFKQEGIVSTPVIDPNSNTMYVVAKTVFNGVVGHYIHALDITTGNEQPGSPVQISAQSTSALGHTTVFNSLHQMNRPGLLLVNGVLYLGFGSNGCNDSNSGWVLSYNVSNLSPIAVFNTSPDIGLTSIWQSGVGLTADAEGNIYAETGEASTSGYDIQNGGQTYCNTVLKLNPDLTVADYFTPWNVAFLNTNDFDLSSTGAVVLPDQTGAYPHELVAAGKYGNVYLLNRDQMGMYSVGADSQILQELTLEVQNPNALRDILFGSPAYWNSTVYFAPNATAIRAFPVLTSGLLGTPVKSKATYTGSHSPSVSASGSTNGILWFISSGLNALSACTSADPAAVNGCPAGQSPLGVLYTSNQAQGGRDKLPATGRFITQTVANGKVFVATNASLEVYGLFESVSVTSGNAQTGTVGTALAYPIQIHAASPYTGQVDAGTVVTFSDGCKKSIPTSCGSFNPTSATTDANGNASVIYTLPQKAGTYTVTFSGIGFSNATATATAIASTGARLIAFGGGGQKQSKGFTLGCAAPPNTPATCSTKPIIAQVQDAFKNPVVGFTINFTATKGAIPNPASAVTDVNGQARTYLQMPNAVTAVTVTGTPATPLTPAKATYAESSVAPVATSVAVKSGNNQSAASGTALPQAMTVVVSDQYGNPFAGNQVTFSDNGAGGTFTNGNTALTDGNGTATMAYTLPSSTATITIDATATGISSPAVFTENDVTPVATKITITGGNNQSALGGSKLPQILAVVVADQFGNPFSGSSVTFSDGGAGGTFSNPNPVVTGANGIASQSYTLPSTGTTVSISATAAGISSPAPFSESIATPVATTISISAGNSQTGAAGTKLPVMLTVLVVDQFGNPVVGNSVTFSDNGAGGSFPQGGVVLTGATGLAIACYVLPATAKTVTVSATATGITGPAAFTEIGVAGPAALISVIQGNGQVAPNGTLLPTALVVVVTDQYNNPVAGVSVTFSDGGSGGSFSNANPGTSAADGTVSQGYTLPPNGGETVNISASAAGVANPAIFTEYGQ